jgi:hypothetical protein
MNRRRSNISRLPEPVRDQINEFLDANHEYDRIIEWLRQQGHHGIERYHLTRWKDTGYQDWLHHHEYLEELAAKRVWIERLAADSKNADFHKAAMAVLAMKLYDSFNRADSSDICLMLDKNPNKIPTLINSFARFSHEVLEVEKFRESCRRAQQQEQAGDKPALEAVSPEMCQRILTELWSILNQAGPAPLLAQPQPQPQTNAKEDA